MKNGIASSTKLSMPRAICCAKMTPGSVPSTQMKISAASASAKPIGSPPNSEIKADNHGRRDDAGDHVAHGASSKDIEREGGHEQRADAHRIECQFQRKSGAGGLACEQAAELEGVEGDVTRD